MLRLTTRPFISLQKRKFTTHQVILKNNESIKIDSDCLPTSATWSIRSLLESNPQQQTSITEEQFNHLFRLAQLRPPESQKDKENLKRDLDQISMFTEHIQELETSQVEPLVQLWEENVSMITRSDVPNQDEQEVRGRSLLKNAEQKHGYFYVVQTNNKMASG